MSIYIASHAVNDLRGIPQASCAATFTDHTQAVWGVSFHHSGDFLASCSMWVFSFGECGELEKIPRMRST